jgi:hypothetical protein
MDSIGSRKSIYSKRKFVSRITTAPLRARVGTHGSVGAAVGPGWLSGPRFDRHFIGTTAAIAILSGLIVAAKPGLLLPVLFLDLRLLGYHHVVSTYTRLCFDADSLRWRGWMIYALLPAVCATVTIPSVAVGAGLLATIYLYWQWFHYTRQRYGIAQAYRRAAVADGAAVVENERRGAHERLDHLIFYLVPLWSSLHRAHQPPETFLGLPVWHPPVRGIAVDIAAVCAVAGLAWWVASRISLWRQRRLAVGHSCYVLSHFAVFYVGYVGIESIDAFWIALHIWHNAQGVAFVWLQNNRSFGDRAGASGRVGRQFMF